MPLFRHTRAGQEPTVPRRHTPLPWIALIALILGAAYTLWMYKRVYLGAPGNRHVEELTDINGREFLMLTLLALAVLWMGLDPKPFTDVMDASVADLLKHVAQSKLP